MYRRQLVLLVFLGILLVACTRADRDALQREAERAARTAVADGQRRAETEMPRLRETVEAVVTEEGSRLRATAEQMAADGRATAAAALATRLAESSDGSDGADHFAARNPFLVGAYYYPWWGSDGTHWRDGYVGQPQLGEYDAADRRVIGQHIGWAVDHGVDFFAVSWWGPGSREDTVLRDDLLAHPLADQIRFAIVYESTGPLDVRDGGIDLSDGRHRRRLQADIDYLLRTYGDEPRLLHVDGRPVVVLYLSRIYRGDVGGALDELRAHVRRQHGVELYLIGDEVYWPRYTPIDTQRLAWYDAVTAYNMHAAEPAIAEGFADEVDRAYRQWQTAAQAAGVAFVPGVIPGFDDRPVRPEVGHPPIPRSPDLFRDQLRSARAMADPDLQMLLVTSWNEWHEDTSIEPAEAFGSTYLETLREVLAVR